MYIAINISHPDSKGVRALEIITGYVIYNPAYTYKFQLKTTLCCDWIKYELKV